MGMKLRLEAVDLEARYEGEDYDEDIKSLQRALMAAQPS